MTAIDENSIIICPPWCITGSSDYPCKGEHWGEGRYVAATGGDAKLTGDRAEFPVVTVMPTFNVLEGDDAPSVTVHIGGADVDAQADVRRHEVIEMIVR